MNANRGFTSPWSRQIIAPVLLARRVVLAGSVAMSVFGGIVAGVQVRAENNAVAGTLHWTNGDSLSGQLLGSTSSHIRWQSPIFTTPSSIDLRYVDSVRFPKAEQAAEAGQPIRFVTQTGDVLDGRLVNLTEQHVVLQSRRLGTVSILRSAARRFFRLPRGGSARTTETAESSSTRLRELDEHETVHLAPIGQSNWKTLSPAQPVLKWQANTAGELTTTTVGAEAFRDLNLPPVAEIDIVLRWHNDPRFRIAFAPPDSVQLSRQTVRLETWDNELTLRTLAGNGQFRQIHTLPKSSKTIRLRLLWNQRIGRLSVFSSDGQLLGTMATGVSAAPAHTGLYIQNRGSDLTLAALRVGNWDEVEPGEAMDRNSHILLDQGETVFGMIQAYDQASRSLVVTERSGGRRKIAISQVVHVELAAHAATGANSPLELRYDDGELLRGTLQSIDDAAVSLKTVYCERPIRCQLAGALVIKIVKAGSTPDDGADAVLQCEDTRLRGTLVPPDSTNSFAWRLVGSASASRLSPDHPAHVVRNLTAPAESPEMAELTDVLHLRDGDAVPCRIQTIDDTYLRLQTNAAKEMRIPREHVKAVQLHAGDQLPEFGFGGSLWTVTEQQENAVDRTAERVVFRGPATLSHGSLLQADGIQFDLQWNDRVGALMMISLFASDVGRRADPSFLVYYMGRQMYVQSRAPQVQGVLRRNMLTNGRATVRISLAHQQCRVFVNQKEVLSQPLRAQDQTGSGIVLSVQQLNTGALPAARLPAPPQAGDLLTISNLQVGRNRVPFGALRIDEPRKELLLTVPRSEKRNPPTHVLVAQNGDLLRGQLIELNEQFVRFTSRGIELAFPRSRLAGIVWLMEMDDRPPPSSRGPQSVYVRLSSGSALTLTACQMVGDQIVGQHAILGDCGVPFNAVGELYIGHHAAPKLDAPYADWVLRPAKEPEFANSLASGSPATDASQAHRLGMDSPLVGTTPEDFQAPLLDGRVFGLRDHSDKIIVLDFWATWCGPCVQELPGTIETVGSFPPDKVMLVSINQQENASTIGEFLKSRDWHLTVALDLDGHIGRQFQVEAIPQTVIIGPGGKVERLFVGANTEAREGLKRALQQLVARQEKPDVLDRD